MRLCWFIVLLFFAFFVTAATAQTATIEELKLSAAAAKNNGEKTKAIFALGEQGFSIHPDTLMRYILVAKRIANSERNMPHQVQAMFYESTALTTKGLIDSAFQLIDESLRLLATDVKDPYLEARFYNQKGGCFMRKNQYKEAIDMGQRTILGGERTKDIMLQVRGKTLVGWAYLEMGQLQDALKWHLAALHTPPDDRILEKYGILFANLALNYNALGKPDTAFEFINKAVSYSRKNENLFSLSNSLAIQGQLFVKSGRAPLAEAPLNEAVAIRKLIGDPFYIVSDMSQLGLYYANNGRPEKGIAICNEGIAIAKKYRLDTKLFFLYSSLAECYRAQGELKKYALTLETIIGLKDTVYQKNSAAALAEMQTKYDTQKKENLIIQQDFDLRRKNYLLYGSLLLLMFAGVFGSLLFREYKRKQHLRIQKMKEEEKLLSVIAVSRAEENERKRIAADLHDNLGAYAAAIASNVDRMGSERNHATVLQELKINSQSIVSQLNDTIWVLKKDNLSLTAISDRIKVFIQQIRASYPQINIDVTEHINADILLPPARAFHVYQIIKEAIINAVKHSGGKNLRVFFESEKTWQVTVSDDGKGLEAADKTMAKGNGLINMKNRSREAEFVIVWNNNEPHGTNVVITPTAN